MSTLGKRVYWKQYRGFESLPVRHRLFKIPQVIQHQLNTGINREPRQAFHTSFHTN